MTKHKYNVWVLTRTTPGLKPAQLEAMHVARTKSRTNTGLNQEITQGIKTKLDHSQNYSRTKPENPRLTQTKTRSKTDLNHNQTLLFCKVKTS